jgi:hypothetical protein
MRTWIRRAAGVAVMAAALTAGTPQATVQAAAEPDWLRALRLRSEALNCRYGLGVHPSCTFVCTTRDAG